MLFRKLEKREEEKKEIIKKNGVITAMLSVLM